MSDLKAKLQRQIEILGLVIASPGTYKIVDLELLFNCNQATIKRDLHDLRCMDIDIHSVSRKGIRVENSIKPALIKDILIKYLIVTSTDSGFEKATHFLVNKIGEKSISNLTLLQYCLDKGYIAEIQYQKPGDRIAKWREVEPLLIYQSENDWRLLANHEGVKKQFVIARIKDVRDTEKKFKRLSKSEVKEVFNTSFKTWLGEERHNVKLKILRPWAERRKIPQLMESQIITKDPDGSIIFETTVNNLDEIAKWIVGQGRGIVVLEPAELIAILLDKAEGVMENYLG